MNATDLGFTGPARQARAEAAREARLTPGETPAPTSDFAAEVLGEATKPAPRRPQPAPARAEPAPERPTEAAPSSESISKAESPGAPQASDAEPAPAGMSAEPAEKPTGEPIPAVTAPTATTPPAPAALGGAEADATTEIPDATTPAPEASRGTAADRAAPISGTPPISTAPPPGGAAVAAADGASPGSEALPASEKSEASRPELAKVATTAPTDADNTAPAAMSGGVSSAPAGAAAPFGFQAALAATSGPEAAWRPASAHPAQVADPRAVLAQITVAAREAPEDRSRIEIRLDPAELGRVQISLTETEHGLRASVSAERPETLELLRRHSETLTRELSSAGYGSVSLDLAASAGRDPKADGRARGRERAFDLANGASGGAADPAPALAPAGAPASARAGEGPLDIRL